MHDCDHADTPNIYVRMTKDNGTTHYAVECLACNQLIHAKRHGGRLLIKHSEIPSGNAIYDRVEANL